MPLDLLTIRSKFPSLQRPAIFFDNPGGTQVAQHVHIAGKITGVAAAAGLGRAQGPQPGGTASERVNCIAAGRLGRGCSNNAHWPREFARRFVILPARVSIA